jgi:hypothetical protein
MQKLIKLMPEYGSSPLWEYADGDLVDNPDPESLPLRDGLRTALRRWAEAYDRTRNHDYPPDSGFAGPAEEDAFEIEGRRLWAELQSQLGPDYAVAYYSQRDGKLSQVEKALGREPASANGPGPSEQRPPDPSSRRGVAVPVESDDERVVFLGRSQARDREAQNEVSAHKEGDDSQRASPAP